MKKILLMLSLIVIGMFLAGCNQESLAGKATFVNKGNCKIRSTMTDDTIKGISGWNACRAIGKYCVGTIDRMYIYYYNNELL